MSGLRPETVVVSAGRPVGAGAPVSPGIELTSTYRDGGEFSYGRESNATWRDFEAAVGELEGGFAVAFASGTAATAAVLETLPMGARVSLPATAYHGTRRFVEERGPRFVVTDSSPDLIWLETPSNPLLETVDIAGVVASASGRSARDVPVVVDNTLATPLYQRPLELGADVVVHSATKFLSGHSDLLLGVAVARSAEWVDALVERRSRHGAVPGPFEAWLALRGLRTLSVRMERSSASAAELAARLAAHDAVERVRYPGWGAVLSFDLAGGAAAADAVVSRLGLVVSATSLGGVETLVERRARYESERAAGVPDGLLRLSVGIEHVEDVWDDLAQALPS